MAILTADGAGTIVGKFTVPADVPAGTKQVRFQGDGGSLAVAPYVGTFQIIDRKFRQITVYDPLAQTFTMDATKQICGIDLWFAAKGTSDILIQVRETDLGLPTNLILTEKRFPIASVVTSGPTRIEFTSVTLQANREYCVVIGCDDAVASVYVAQLGKFDAANQKWVTAQPYTVGVLLSSSNARTWTPHQDRDLTFRLLAPVYAPTSRTIDMGNVAVVDASDLIVLADTERPAAIAECKFKLTLIDHVDAPIYTVGPMQPVELPARYTGNVKVEALLSGSSTFSPVLHKDISIAVGDLAESEVYITRAITAGVNSNITITLEALVPGGSSIAVHVEDAGSTWTLATLDSAAPVGAGWEERTYKVLDFDEETYRIRLTLNGVTNARPRVRSLRAVTVAA